MTTERDIIDHHTHAALASYNNGGAAVIRQEVQQMYTAIDVETAERLRWMCTGMTDVFGATHAEWGILGTQIEYVVLIAASQRTRIGMPLAARAMFEISTKVAEAFTEECEGRDAVRQAQRKPISDHSL